MSNDGSPGALTVAGDFWFGGRQLQPSDPLKGGVEFFGWGVLILVSASELEARARSVKGERDESGNQNLGV